MTTYYVSTTGSNSQTGTIDKPFASLQYAHNLAKPGDTIFIRGGTYNLTTGMQLTKDGTSGQPITVSNYGNEKVIFDGAKMSSGYYKGFMLDMSSVSWNHIKGLEFKNGPDGGVIIRDASHNNIIENLNVHHIGPGTLGEAKGIMLFGASSNNLLLNNDSHDNRDAGYGGADGFQISVTGTGNILRGNRAYGNSDDGIDLFNVHDGTNAAPVLLDGNWSFDNGFNASHQAGGDGTGFKLGGNRSGTGGTSGGHTLTNNIAWDNRVYGFYENGANKTSYLYNNSAYDNGAYNYLFSAGASDTLTNNLAYGTGKVLASGTIKNNTWNMSVSINGSDFMTLADTAARGARASRRFAYPTPTSCTSQSGSDLIDKGIKVGGISYSGNSPDLGAVDWNGNGTPLLLRLRPPLRRPRRPQRQ